MTCRGLLSSSLRVDKGHGVGVVDQVDVKDVREPIFHDSRSVEHEGRVKTADTILGYYFRSSEVTRLSRDSVYHRLTRESRMEVERRRGTVGRGQRVGTIYTPRVQSFEVYPSFVTTRQRSYQGLGVSVKGSPRRFKYPVNGSSPTFSLAVSRGIYR